MCIHFTLKHTTTHTRVNGQGWLFYTLGKGGVESHKVGLHTVKERHTAACTVVFIQSYAILPSLPDVELLLCVDAPRVVEPRKALGRSRWRPIFSQTIFVIRLFKVITGRAWDTQ